MNNVLERFVRIITYTLLIVSMVFISFQTIELIWETIKSLSLHFKEVGFNYNPEYSKTVLVLFFNVLLALEILETIKVFNQSHTVKVRIILLICLIASSRKIFVMDIQNSNATEDFGLAGLILALAVGYYLVNKHALVSEGDRD